MSKECKATNQVYKENKKTAAIKKKILAKNSLVE
jgi:hypothetical protein